jgi:hypothetical protein
MRLAEPGGSDGTKGGGGGGSGGSSSMERGTESPVLSLGMVGIGSKN